MWFLMFFVFLQSKVLRQMSKKKTKKRKEGKRKKWNWEDIYDSFINGKWLLSLEYIVALIPLIILLWDIWLDCEQHKETAVYVEIDRAGHTNSHINISLSNDNLVPKRMIIYYLRGNGEKGRINYTNQMSLKAFHERLNKERIINRILLQLDNSSMMNELVWFPVVLDVEYQEKSNIIHRKFLFKVNCLLMDFDDYNDIYSYGIHNIHYIKKLPSYCREERVLKRYYKKSGKEFSKGMMPRNEVLHSVRQRNRKYKSFYGLQ